MKKPPYSSRYRIPLVLLSSLVTLYFSIACSGSDDASPTTGTSSQKVEGRLLIASETESSVAVIDLEQSALESSMKSYSSSPTLIASPEGNFAFVMQSSGNRVDVLEMGDSVSITSETEESEEDDHGHDHGKPRLSGEDESESTTSVSTVDLSLTGENLGYVVSKGEWMTFQFQDKVYVLSEEDLENNLNSITQSVLHEKVSVFPGIPLDSEHIALGANVFEIEEDTQLHTSTNVTALGLTSDNILSATRPAEGVALYGTDQGLLLVCEHTESGNVEWEDFFVPYPSILEENIFLASGHEHEEGEEEEEGEDEHEEVMENTVATDWATHDGLGHAFAHLTHEDHSAGIYLIEASTLEEDEVADAWEFLAGSSNSSYRPVAITIAKMPEEEHEEGEEEHADEYRLLILTSEGHLRIHDAVDEGSLITIIENVIPAVTDFHEGEGNLPGLTSGLGKVYIGDPSSNEIHQIDLINYSIELTWVSDLSPNALLFLGESSQAEGAEGHDHE